MRGSGEASEESLLIPSVENLVVVLFNMMMRWDFSMRHSSFFATLRAQQGVVPSEGHSIQCEAADVEYLHTKEGIASLRDLIRCTMRMSPDRIVIGEVRGAEALDLLKAWNTGHPGGVSTIHANSAQKGLMRIEQLVQEAGVVPSREMIAEAVHLLVYMEKVVTKRVVKDIINVRGAGDTEYDLVPLI